MGVGVGRNSALFPSAAERQRWETYLTECLLAAQQRVEGGPVAADDADQQWRATLDQFDFEASVETGELLDWTIAAMEHGLVHITHPKYLGLFNPAPAFAAQCADRIAAAFNPQLASATTSPAAVAIEAHVARAWAVRLGVGVNAGGHVAAGGSEANGTGLICALTRKTPDFAAFGSRAFSGQPVFYISSDSHLAWIKLAHQAGIGRAAARQIATDGNGRMDAAALATAITADKADGHVPFMVVATAGTTNAGMVDPLQACAAIAKRERLWYHVDAAWGGALIASPRLRDRIAGIELADSITLDAHKWLAATMGCGVFLTPHQDALSAAFDVRTSFMPSHTAGIDPYLITAQWSRRFLGLRLFLTLASGGWQGLAGHVERSVDLACLFADEITSRGWVVCNDPGLAVVCAIPPNEAVAPADIVRRVVASGSAWVSTAVFEGSQAVRVCVTNGRTTADDIRAVVEALEQARADATAERLPPSPPSY